ncbi:hypothetical protein [Bradyrhizobium sp. SEMIA]|nr:hypothetical protein [Bradyrhizobium sp. SEMIA]QOG19203.1 hypothetical protein FOM02_19495 [Bradyrhizobium sp. SEMIA]
MQRSGAIEAVASHGDAINQVIDHANIVAVPAATVFGSVENDRKRHIAAR